MIVGSFRGQDPDDVGIAIIIALDDESTIDVHPFDGVPGQPVPLQLKKGGVLAQTP